jgi:hypothetical protein
VKEFAERLCVKESPSHQQPFNWLASSASRSHSSLVTFETFPASPAADVKILSGITSMRASHTFRSRCLCVERNKQKEIAANCEGEKHKKE